MHGFDFASEAVEEFWPGDGPHQTTITRATLQQLLQAAFEAGREDERAKWHASAKQALELTVHRATGL